MAIETKELDTTQEETSPNGHEEWFETDDDQAFLKYILEGEPVEELVPVFEWKTRVLCKALDAKERIQVEMAAFNPETKRTDYRLAFDLIVMLGCYNPKTGKHFLTESKRKALMGKRDGGGPVVNLALTVLRISNMLGGDTKRKN